MNTGVTFAQFGCGYWGPNLLRNFSANKACRMKWVAEPNAARHAYLQENYPSVQVTADWQDVMADPEVDAVIIATPAATHFALAKMALDHHKHVFVEKPLAMSTVEAEELVRLSDQQQRKICVGHTFLYNAAVKKIKEYIDRGELGDIYYIFTQRLNLGQVRQDVNVLWNLAPHDFAILLYWLDEEPSRVSARGLSFLQNGIDDVAFVTLDFPSGKAAHVHVSWLDPCKVRKMVLIGSKKMIVYDDTSADAKVVIYDKGIDKKTMYNPLEPISSFGQFQLLQRMGDVVAPYFKFPEPLKVQADHFIECLLHDNTPHTDGRHGLQVVKILEAAQKSLSLHCEQSLETVTE